MNTKNIQMILVLIIISIIIFYFGLQVGIRINTTNQSVLKSSARESRRLTPTPLQGPGIYACDPFGVCNNYGEDVRKKDCKITFADKNCLGKCKDIKNRCSN